MRTFIHSKSTQGTDSLRQYLQRHLRRVTERFSSIAQSIHVRLRDENGPKGGLDQHCTIEVRCRRLGPIIAEAKQRTLRLAVDEACEKIEHALDHAVGALREKRRTPRKTALRRKSSA